MRLRLATGVLAGLGSLVTGYLTLARYDGARLACPTSGCETVQHSRYAELAGIPVALLGLLAFLVILGSALADARTVGLGATLAAFLFGGYLLVVQIALIHALCTWCVTSDVLLALLLAVGLLRLRRAPAPAAPRSSG
ncbi:MAG: hypothetical protein QOE29_945 [Gaiellaceae bacterium]|jgi:uncharacterized membrane protein|nr:hypothetical protein [Gaiellaceae bacterium]